MLNSGGSLTVGIFWDRLINICDEVYQAFLQSSFSPVVRDAYDAVFVIFDKQARLLAQASLGPPSFIGTSPHTITQLLRKFATDSLKPGDVIGTNDPWIGTGQINDLSMIRPIFRERELIGFTGTVQHLPDIGGAHTMSGLASEIYEEGLRIPPRKIVDQGVIDQDLLELIAYNVRVPEQVVGDIRAGITANSLGEKLVLESLVEYQFSNLATPSEAIINKSLEVMRSKIREIDSGEYTHEIMAEGYEEMEQIRIVCTLNVSGEVLTADFQGTSPCIRRGLNVPFVYTSALARYALKCVISPELPNNEGSMVPIMIKAPDGCVLNAPPPVSTSARHITGWFVPMAVWGAFSKARRERVMAESGMPAMVTFAGKTREGKSFVLPIGPTIIGGSGARVHCDGDIMAIPTNIARVPIETWEKEAGGALMVERCEVVSDSGGAGKYRGGLSTESVFLNLSEEPVAVGVTGGRTKFAAQGYLGGHPGKLHEVYFDENRVFGKGVYELGKGGRLRIRTASGGGMYNPLERETERVLEDLRNGYISLDSARAIYGKQVSAKLP